VPYTVLAEVLNVRSFLIKWTLTFEDKEIQYLWILSQACVLSRRIIKNCPYISVICLLDCHRRFKSTE